MFTVAKSAGFDIMSDVADAVDRAQAQGQTLAQFQADLEPLLRNRGWWGKQTVVGPDGRLRVVKRGSPRRLKTIFRTNLRVSAAAARWERVSRTTKDRFPYLMWPPLSPQKAKVNTPAQHVSQVIQANVSHASSFDGRFRSIAAADWRRRRRVCVWCREVGLEPHTATCCVA